MSLLTYDGISAIISVTVNRGKERANMKSTGIVRKVDELGRIVIPKELRRKFGIDSKDGLEIYVEEDKIILKKYEPSCIFCQNSDNIFEYQGKNICPECAKAIGAHVE